MRKSHQAITLLELLIGLCLLSVIILALNSIDIFSHFHVIDASRRIMLQKELSSSLDHMNKWVTQGAGDNANTPMATQATGFTVRVDLARTPSDYNDDAIFTYTANSGVLSCACQGTGCPFTNIVLATHLIARVSAGPSVVVPESPDGTTGFYVKYDPSQNLGCIEVELVARPFPAQGISTNNPQFYMRTQMCARGSAAR